MAEPGPFVYLCLFLFFTSGIIRPRIVRLSELFEFCLDPDSVYRTALRSDRGGRVASKFHPSFHGFLQLPKGT